MKKLFLVIAFFLFFSIPVYSQQASPQQKTYEAQVTNISLQNKQQVVQVDITSGDKKGQQVLIPQFDQQQTTRQNIQKGDKILISFMNGPNGQSNAFIVDHIRRDKLLLLFFIFLIVVFAIGRWKGFFSFLGMVFSFLIIAQFIVPNIIQGNDPLLISLLGSLFIIPVTFYISHGVNTKTTIAVVGTFISLALTGILAYIFVTVTRLTGYAAEEAIFLQAASGGSLDIRNLLLAGIVIGAMGVLDDITVSQTSIVDKLAKANLKYTRKDLFFHGMDVGRDHIASLVNTLILVYTGAALPLFLLFSQSNVSYNQIINQEIVATEIVRTLVSSIGIIAAVPITTFIACFYLKKE